MDFMLNTNIDVSKVANLAENALDRGRWVALLISKHISRIHEPARSRVAEQDIFLDEKLNHQQHLQEELGIAEDQVDAAYAFIQWCARLSLILC
jgi:hypothetical protein